MTRLLLDTSGYSAFMRDHSEVVAALQEADEVCFNPVIFGELLAGFIKGKKRKKNENELKTFLQSPRVKILDVNAETAERYAVILNSLWKAGTPHPPTTFGSLPLRCNTACTSSPRIAIIKRSPRLSWTILRPNFSFLELNVSGSETKASKTPTIFPIPTFSPRKSSSFDSLSLAQDAFEP